MAWAPSTDFEDELVDLQPGFNFEQDLLAFEAKRTFDPRPKSTYDYLTKRDERNKELEKLDKSKSNEIRSSLAMMEYIQEIAGTKSLGEHATMSDWDDRSTVEQEAAAMVRRFGMSLPERLPTAPPKEYLPKGKIHTARNGRRAFPLILDPDYFLPGKRRESCDTSVSSKSSLYDSAKSNLDDTKSSQSEEHSYCEIPYEVLCETEPESSKVKHIKKKNSSYCPSQGERRKIAK